MIKKQREKHTCVHCKKDFIVVWKMLPSKMEDKRDSYYLCPYCRKEYKVNNLLGNEDVDSEKID